MKKHPLKMIGTIFLIIAAAELLICLILTLTPITGNSLALGISSGVLGIQALIFGAIGGSFCLYVRRKEQKRDRLVSGGYYEMATVVDLDRSYAVRINGRNPWYVICRIERDGALHEYRSDMLLSRPALESGDTVRVYLDRRDDRLYYVDVEGSSPPIIRHG